MPRKDEVNDVETEVFYKQLDSVNSNYQALVLPIALSVSLALSYVLLTTRIEGLPSSSSLVDGPSLAVIFSSFAAVANIAVSFLFTKTEFNWILSQSRKLTEGTALKTSIIVSAILTLIAFSAAPGAVGVWPIQNIINVCITVTMARALQLPQLPSVILALVGLTFYDFFAVIGTQQFTDGGASIMESVARAKIGGPDLPPTTSDLANSALALKNSGNSLNTILSSVGERLGSIFSASSWRPGLFEVSINGKVTDVLGIADVLFPSLLATWALRFDSRSAGGTNSTVQELSGGTEKRDTPTFSAVCAGFVIGCFLCEVFQTGSGQPALIYIVPSSLVMLSIEAVRKRNFMEMWTR